MLQETLSKIEELQKKIEAFQPFDADRIEKVIKKLRLDWNYHSNNIEGNSLSFGETKTFLMYGLTASGKPLKDHLEIKNHNEAILDLHDFVKGGRDLTESYIKSLNQLLLGDPYEQSSVDVYGNSTKRLITPGSYKKIPNYVETDTKEKRYFTDPLKVQDEMDDLLKWYKENRDRLH
ncbi:MAG: hypothetical protein K8R21_14635, partial [Leptospira sp.]|nr:hypothetical protein [Leptospira sp.]